MSAEESFKKTPDQELDDILVRPGNRAAEKELYAGYYERIYPAIQGGGVDFTLVAKMSGLKERRVRESLLYRLSGEVPQLFGLQKSFCYVCKHMLGHRECTEPICLGCLKKVDDALHECGMYKGALPDETQIAPTPKLAPKADEAESPAMTQIPVADYQRLLEELDFYKEKLAEFLPDLVPEAISQIKAQENTLQLISVTEPETETTPTPAFLDILDIPDIELSDEIAALSQLPDNNTMELRHYGFKKLRGH